jgi:hypothetical protein
MEVKFNKEIMDYKEDVFMGLNLRQCSSLIIGGVAALGIYFGTHNILSENITATLILLISVPCVLAGFFNYNGLTFEKFVLTWLKFQLTPKHLTFRTENVYYKMYEAELAKMKIENKKNKQGKKDNTIDIEIEENDTI